MSKHEIEYKRPAFLGNSVLAHTWVGTTSHRLFIRHTELLRKSAG